MNSNTKWRFLGTHVTFIGELDSQDISLSYSNKPPISIPREHFSIHRKCILWKIPEPVIAECSFSPDSSPLVRVPKKSLFDPGGCPFTLFREKIGRDGKRFLRNFMDFSKKYFSGIKTESSWPTGSMRWPDPEIRPKIRKRFLDRI